MHIDIHDEDVINVFREGSCVFKIIAQSKDGSTRQVHIANDKHTFIRRLRSHKYNPLLYVVDIYHRLAYLYDCLNRNFNEPRNEIFIFLWRRKHKSNKWSKWFTVNPSIDDSLY